jgi:hypothetical protein
MFPEPRRRLVAMKYLGYKLVEEVNHERLVLAINELIQQGWEPHGPVVIVPRHQEEISDRLFQAMVKIQRET